MNSGPGSGWKSEQILQSAFFSQKKLSSLLFVWLCFLEETPQFWRTGKKKKRADEKPTAQKKRRGNNLLPAIR
jgi:hypothetical protein